MDYILVSSKCFCRRASTPCSNQKQLDNIGYYAIDWKETSIYRFNKSSPKYGSQCTVKSNSKSLQWNKTKEHGLFQKQEESARDIIQNFTNICSILKKSENWQNWCSTDWCSTDWYCLGWQRPKVTHRRSKLSCCT